MMTDDTDKIDKEEIEAFINLQTAYIYVSKERI